MILKHEIKDIILPVCIYNCVEGADVLLWLIFYQDVETWTHSHSDWFMGCGFYRKVKLKTKQSVSQRERNSHGVCFLLRRSDLSHLSDYLHWSSESSLWTLFLQRMYYRCSEFSAEVSTVSESCSSRSVMSSNQPHTEEPGWEGQRSRKDKERARWEAESRGMLVLNSVVIVMCWLVAS